MNLRNIIKSGVALAMSFGLVACSNTPTTTPTTSAAPSSSPTTSSSTTLRVASWNVDSKAHPDINEMSNILNELGIEIMGFQEIDVNNTRNDYDMVEAFINENYPYAHFAKGRDFANGGFGVGVTSKYELLEESSFPIESTSSRATKTLERTVIEKDGKQIAFYVTHTSWENTELRRRQFQQIIERVKADPAEYIILVADWNADQSLYEYTSFLEDFNIANGMDGVWYDTFNGTDDSMAVMTVDNIITTKNIEISNVNTYHSDMADHDMIYCDLTLLDEPKTFTKNHNYALGQGVTVSSVADGSDPLMAVDYDETTAWKSSGENTTETLTLELAEVMSEGNVTLTASAPADTTTISISTDGIHYTEVSSETINEPFKFIEFTFNNEEAKQISIEEISVTGTVLKNTNPDETNILTNGTFDDESGWESVVSGEPSEEATEASTMTATITNGEYVITRENAEGYGQIAVSTEATVKPNTKYQLSFNQKTDTLDSGSFKYEVIQKDSEGNEISKYNVGLSDNLNLAKEYRRNDYTFVTAPNAASITVRFTVSSGEGTLYLDDVCVKETIQIDHIYLDTENTTLSVGDTATVNATYNPTNYNDLTFHWVSSDESVVSVDENGNITANATGQAYVGLQSDSDLIAESMILITVE